MFVCSHSPQHTHPLHNINHHAISIYFITEIHHPITKSLRSIASSLLRHTIGGRLALELSTVDRVEASVVLDVARSLFGRRLVDEGVAVD